jgi:redox-sensitive bicupin YhaK (pirin superfamily)
MSSILQRITPHIRDIGFPVRRLLPDAKTRSVGPFVFLDHMGPTSFEAGTTAGDVRAHPHIGLATISYLFSGAIVHRDSLGSVQRIEPGDVNWMTSGRGIVHSERIPADIRDQAVIVQGLQMWVALPQADETCEPGFWHYPSDDLPRIALDGVSVHVLVGSVAGQTSPVKAASPTLYAALDMHGGSNFNVAPDYAERAVYVVSGSIAVDDELVESGTLIVLESDTEVELIAQSNTRLMLVGGAPLDGPRTVWWNFVTSSKERLEAAKAAWANQDPAQFPKVPDEVEWIPLPER